MCSKLFSTGRRRREIICTAAEGSSERRRAGQVRAKRRPVSEYEPENLFGAASYNDKNLLCISHSGTWRAKSKDLQHR
jgi:hypothetical protein